MTAFELFARITDCHIALNLSAEIAVPKQKIDWLLNLFVPHKPIQFKMTTNGTS